MAFKMKHFGDYVQRRDYSKVSGKLKLPNLIEVQTDNYQWFMKDGIQEVFDEIFPITDPEGKTTLSLLSWEVKKPRRSLKQAQEESKIYEVPIYAKLQLTVIKDDERINSQIAKTPDQAMLLWVREEFGFKNPVLSKQDDNVFYFEDINAEDKIAIEIIIKKQDEEEMLVDYTLWRVGEVFLGDFPLMTDKGTFIINGSEKVVVSQLVRSPGSYYKKNIDPKTGKIIYFNDIIPSRGTWLEFESHIKKVKTKQNNLYKHIFQVKIDKSRKTNATVLFTALGLKKDDLLALYNDDQLLFDTYESDYISGLEKDSWEFAVQEIYKKIRSGETATVDGASKFLFGLLFDKRKYDLTKAGRFKLIQKLSIVDRLLNRILAEDIKDVKGNVVFKKGYLITKKDLELLHTILNAGAMLQEINFHPDIKSHNKIQRVLVYANNEMINPDDSIAILGVDPSNKIEHITIPDIIASFSYLLNITKGLGNIDDIDHLGNRRVRTVGELLQNQFRIGMARIEKNVKEKMSTADSSVIKPSNIINNKPLTAVIGEFFNLSQLSQFMDQTNPLSELTNKRRITALGPGGLSRERAGLEVRDVHYSHYGRICPIETPEGPNIGLINNLSTYAHINKYGFIETPYRKVNNAIVSEINHYLTADQEKNYVISQANIAIDDQGKIIEKQVAARFNGENIISTSNEVDYIDVSPRQIVSIATSCIPFLENDDANRALMGANMQRQAIPLIKAQSPLVGTGVEYAAARDSGLAIISLDDGIVDYVDSKKITVKHKDRVKVYELNSFDRSNSGTALIHSPLIKPGDTVSKGQILADGASMEKGELALGQNVMVAFTTWNGYNYEDAIIISERLVYDDVFTSIHIEEYTIERRQTKQGEEEITREIPNIPDSMRRYLDVDGIVMVGAEVKEGDILVGKVTPKGQTQLSAEDKLLQAIFGEKSRNVKDNSLIVPNGGAGIIQAVKRFSRKDGHDLPVSVLEIVKIYVVQKRKIQEGDKMAGRHGNKGVISKVLPIEDMPHLVDGTPVDIMLNPLGVPSRMNIGQVLELHLGMAAKKLGLKVATPVFEGVSNKELIAIMTEAKMDNFGKETLIDGQTGETFGNKISVGVMYMLKLSHMVEDKIHARNVGPYSLITQQPLGGKAQNGGQRFGEMEVWALEAYGAAHTLREILTIKSDDIIGRTKLYTKIAKGEKLPLSGIPESFNVLIKELQGLSINVVLKTKDGKEHKMLNYEEDEESKF